MPLAQEYPDEGETRPARSSAAGLAAVRAAVALMRRKSKGADPTEEEELLMKKRTRGMKTDAAVGGRLDKVKAAVWVTFENPKSSLLAAVISYFILTCIVVSSLCIHLETMLTFEGYRYVWAGLEVLFVVVFSIEYGIRFWASPQTSKEFFWETYNLIDFVAIVPFYIVIVAEAIAAMTGYELSINLAMIRTLRLCRIFKIAKYSHSTQLLIRSMKRAIGELMFLVGFMFCALVFFGTLMYAVEQGQWNEEMGCYVREGDSACSPFESIPGTFYWGITTMTTVGYGDVLPTTRAGTVVACMTMFMGILVIALPVTMISNAFMDAHDEVSMDVKREHIQDHMENCSPAERALIESAGELRGLLDRVHGALAGIHVSGSELLISQGKKETPEDALAHWDERVALASDVVHRGLKHLKAFAVILRPNHVC